MWACFEKYSATRKRDILVFGWLEQRWVCFFLPFKISNYQRNSYQNDQLYVHRYCTSFPYSLEGTLMSRVISSEDQAVYQACWTWSSRGGISFPKGKKTTIKCGRWGGRGSGWGKMTLQLWSYPALHSRYEWCLERERDQKPGFQLHYIPTPNVLSVLILYILLQRLCLEPTCATTGQDHRKGFDKNPLNKFRRRLS